MLDENSDKASKAVVRPQSRMVAEIPKEGLRSIFHLLVGRPDTQHKILRRRICVTPKHLYDLHRRVSEKLNNHHLDGLVASADITFSDKRIVQCSWSEFEAYRWEISKATQEIRLNWQFLLIVQGFEMPQRHSLSVKISSSGRPFELLQALFTKGPDEMTPEEMEPAPMVCRVDFISHVIGQELIALVEEWNASLPSPQVDSSWIHKIEYRGEAIAKIVRYSTPIVLTFVCLAALRFGARGFEASASLTIESAVMLMQWMFVSLLVLYSSEKLSEWLGRRCAKALHDYGRFVPFGLTSGDREAQLALEKKNKSIAWQFVVTATSSLVVNIAATILAAMLWSPNA